MTDPNFDARKIETIAFVAALQQEEILNAFEAIIQVYQSAKKSETAVAFHPVAELESTQYSRTVYAGMTIEDLVQEKDWQPQFVENKTQSLPKLKLNKPLRLPFSNQKKNKK